MMKKILIFFLLFPGFLYGENDKAYYYKIVTEAWNTKVYEVAIPLLEKAITEFPGEPDFFSNLVYMYEESKSYKKAFDLSAIAYARFPDHKCVKDSYAQALGFYGYQLYEEKKYDEAFSVLENAYKKFPEYKWVAFDYSFVLRQKKQYDKAIGILETLTKKEPEPVFGWNLSWAYYDKGNELFVAGKLKESYGFFKLAYESGDKSDPNVVASYLYKLPHLKRFDEALNVIDSAHKRFGQDEKLYDPVFWVYFNLANQHKESGEYEKMLDVYLENLLPITRADFFSDDGFNHKELVFMRLNADISGALQNICPYWLRFTGDTKARAYALADYYKARAGKEIYPLYLSFFGSVLYREGKIEAARRTLDQAYTNFVSSEYGKDHSREFSVRFPLRGTYLAGANESREYITHMGFSRFCYDITGTDETGNIIKPGTKGTKLTDYYGFGALIFSPFAGIVTEVTDKNPDAQPSDAPSGEINFIYLRTEGLDNVAFVHIKQGSARVQIGQKVRVGDPIAELGNAQSTRPHLHIGIFTRDWLVTEPLFFVDYSVVKDGKRSAIKKGRPGGIGGYEVIEVK
jgi:tetratricopeptide (TPR) repeat protein